MNKSSVLDLKSTGMDLESLFVSRSISPMSKEFNLVRVKTKSTAMSAPLGLKVNISVKILKLFLAAQLVVLSGDVMLNPGPYGNESFCCSVSSGCDCSFSSRESEPFASQINASASTLNDRVVNCFFDLGLPNKGLRIGHWNVNRLTSSKFDQIKLFLTNGSGKQQVDVLLLNETFLKHDIPDSLYFVFRPDRLTIL